ncbi:MAG: hypothetical protein K9H63_03555 [Sphingobacteriaceae bacterium]|nr:hypothetical protein [Sphingobacteriaceae bacterium]
MITPYLSSILSIFLALGALNSNSPQTQNLLGVKGPIVFEKTSYNLSWSSHPSATYYKHEYLAKGVNPDRYTEMFMIEFLADELASPKNMAVEKISSTNDRKKIDPYAFAEGLKQDKTGNDVLINFIQSDANGKAAGIVEWNTYRYIKITTKEGKKGLLLLAISRRAYGKSIPAFLSKIKSQKSSTAAALAKYKLPEISLK